MAHKISVLVSARNDSKFLAKFLINYFANTHNLRDTELLVMTTETDTWNSELIWFFSDRFGVKFYSENYQLGRSGLHKYFNDLADHASGDWLIYFCEDHNIIKPGWDQEVRGFITRNDMDPEKIYTIVPKFDNVGAMNHIVSRGFVDALGGKIGRHGWIDSYINELNETVFGDHSERVRRMDEELFHDFSHDHPNPMEQGNSQSPVGLDGTELPKFKDPIIRLRIEKDANKFKEALEAGK